MTMINARRAAAPLGIPKIEKTRVASPKDGALALFSDPNNSGLLTAKDSNGDFAVIGGGGLPALIKKPTCSIVDGVVSSSTFTAAYGGDAGIFVAIQYRVYDINGNLYNDSGAITSFTSYTPPNDPGRTVYAKVRHAVRIYDTGIWSEWSDASDTYLMVEMALEFKSIVGSESTSTSGTTMIRAFLDPSPLVCDGFEYGDWNGTSRYKLIATSAQTNIDFQIPFSFTYTKSNDDDSGSMYVYLLKNGDNIWHGHSIGSIWRGISNSSTSGSWEETLSVNNVNVSVGDYFMVAILAQGQWSGVTVTMTGKIDGKVSAPFWIKQGLF